MKDKRKNINKKKMAFILVTIAFIIFITYILVTIVKLIIKPTDTILVEKGLLSSEESLQGYVIRNESVLKGDNYKNGLIEIKTEGEKVSKDEPVFRYYTQGEDDLVKKIQELDSKIAEAWDSSTNIFSSDIKILEDQIEEKLNAVYSLNDLQKIKEYKNDINSYITKKAKIAGEYSPAGSYLKQLIDERSKYENQLNSGSEIVVAPEAGVISYRVDGLEEILNPEKFDTLDKSTLEGLKLKTGQIVSKSTEAGKIIDNFTCYIACIIKNDNSRIIKENDTIKIRLSNNKEVSTKVVHIKPESEKESLVVLKIDKYVEELINYRKISFDIIWWSASGIKVPNTALHTDENDFNYIIRIRNGFEDRIYVKILKQNENYSIIENYSDTTELKEKGVSAEDRRHKVSLYDEIEI